MATAVMRHKSFVGPTMYWNLHSLNENREDIRAGGGVHQHDRCGERRLRGRTCDEHRAILRRRVVSRRGGRAGRAAASGFYGLPYCGRRSRRLTRLVRPVVHRAGRHAMPVTEFSYCHEDSRHNPVSLRTVRRPLPGVARFLRGPGLRDDLAAGRAGRSALSAAPTSFCKTSTCRCGRRIRWSCSRSRTWTPTGRSWSRKTCPAGSPA